MATAGENKKYTAADFHRYHSGTMNEAEMHALEKAALEDPFLADSLEGYAFTETGEADIVELRKRIEQKDKNRKSLLFFLKDSVWVKVAAILVIMLGVFYFARKNNYPLVDRELAKAEKDKELSPPVIKPDSSVETYKWSTPATATDTIKSAASTKGLTLTAATQLNSLNDTVYTVTSANAMGTTAPASYSYSVTPSTMGAVTDTAGNTSFINVTAEKNNDGFVMNKAPNWTTGNGYNYNGRVVDIQGQPIPNASILVPLKRTGAVTDTGGRFRINSYDTISLATVAAVGYSATTTKLLNNFDQTIVLSPATNADSVVFARGEARRKDAAAKEEVLLEGKMRGLEIEKKTAANDSAGFQKYVAENMKLPAAGNKQLNKGTVILSFIIKKDGTPAKIKIEKSLSEDCDKEATRLLTEGPKWNYKNEKRTRVSINF